MLLYVPDKTTEAKVEAAPGYPDVILVHVTEDDIREGRPTSTGCPIARALRRMGYDRPLPNLAVSLQGVHLDGRRYDCAGETAAFIRIFDYLATYQARYPGGAPLTPQPVPGLYRIMRRYPR